MRCERAGGNAALVDQRGRDHQDLVHLIHTVQLSDMPEERANLTAYQDFLHGPLSARTGHETSCCCCCRQTETRPAQSQMSLQKWATAAPKSDHS